MPTTTSSTWKPSKIISFLKGIDQKYYNDKAHNALSLSELNPNQEVLLLLSKKHKAYIPDTITAQTSTPKLYYRSSRKTVQQTWQHIQSLHPEYLWLLTWDCPKKHPHAPNWQGHQPVYWPLSKAVPRSEALSFSDQVPLNPFQLSTDDTTQYPRAAFPNQTPTPYWDPLPLPR